MRREGFGTLDLTQTVLNVSASFFHALTPLDCRNAVSFLSTIHNPVKAKTEESAQEANKPLRSAAQSK
jgi:hypothetical protein